MTQREALAWFAEELADGICDDECVQCNANKKAYEALEKQIPKKPNVGVQHFLKCACCDSVIRKTEKFCHECGQALDWSDAE